MKLLARHVYLHDRDLGLSTVYVSDDRTEIEILPFTVETHSTQYIEGSLRITVSEGKYLVFSDYFNKYL